MRKLLLTLAAFALSGTAFAQTNIGTVSIEQLGTANDVDAVCTSTNLDIRDLSSAQDSVQCNAGTNLNTSALALETTLGNRLAEATFIGRVPAGASPADNESNTITALSRFGSFNFFFDGTTWDRAPGTAADGMLVNLGANNDVTVTSGAVDITSLPNEGQQTAANSISVTPDTDNDPIGAPAAAVPGEAVQIAGTDGTNLTVPYIDPCQREARSVYRVDIVTATTTEIAAAVASEFYWVCSVNLVTAAANNVIIVEDDTATNCPSPTAGVSSGGTTAAEGYNFAANGGIVVGGGSNWVMKTTTANRSFCIITSAATQLSGTITYVSAP